MAQIPQQYANQPALVAAVIVSKWRQRTPLHRMADGTSFIIFTSYWRMRDTLRFTLKDVEAMRAELSKWSSSI